MWSQQEGIIDTFRYSVLLWCIMFIKFSKFVWFKQLSVEIIHHKVCLKKLT